MKYKIKIFRKGYFNITFKTYQSALSWLIKNIGYTGLKYKIMKVR